MKTKPWKHQKREYEERRDSPARAQFWSMRSGKSKSVIDLACYNWKKGRIDCVVVFAPNGVHENWVRREIPAHHWTDVPRRTVAWSAERFRLDRRYGDELASLNKGFEGLTWVAANTEAFGHKKFKEFLGKFVRGKRFLLVIDESQDFGAPGSKRTKALRALAKRAAMKRILTGTPFEDSPLRAYAQFQVLEEGALGCATAAEFRDHYADYKIEKTKGGRQYPKLVGYKNLDELKARIAAWTSVVLREDCDDMPEVVEAPLFYMPSEKQLKLYREIHDQTLVEDREGRLSVVDGGVRLIKLQQALCGYRIDKDGSVERVEDPNPRIAATLGCLKEQLKLGKAIVWAWFRLDIEALSKALRAEGIDFCSYYGGTAPTARDKAIDAFAQERGGPVVFLGNQKAGGRGLNLSRARTLIYYSSPFGAEIRKQSIERATLVGGVNVDAVDVLAQNPFGGAVLQMVDSYILASNRTKTALADSTSRAGLKEYLAGMQV
jgi:hypothetical protein